MGIRKFKPVTAGTRHRSVITFEAITSTEAEKSLLRPMQKHAGRNNHGHITVRHRGGGSRRKYRVIDFRRDKLHVPAHVEAIEYDPNRSANIARLLYADGERRYILAPEGIAVGAKIMAGEKADFSDGNSLPLNRIPVGTFVHNIELKPGQGGRIVRSAGAAAQLMSRENDYALLKLPSNEMRLIPVNCYATIGRVGNTDYANISLGKAGASRWRGRRPKVRGCAMNPVDHPHGGGEGKSNSACHPVSPTGVKAKGYKTRKKNKASNRVIVKRRK